MSSEALLSMGLDEFSCPNCSIIIDPDKVQSITLGCIVRYALKAERAHKKELARLSASLSARGSNNAASSHIATSDDVRELFTTSSVYVTALPPVIAAIKCTLGELTKRSKLLAKDVHVCIECYETFIDGKEVELRQSREDAEVLKRHLSESTPKSLQALDSRNRSEAFEFNSRNSNRHSDMAFTDTQVRQRIYERDMAIKKRGKESLLGTHNADIEALGVDWDVISPNAAREMRRVAGEVSTNMRRLSPLRGQGGTGGGGGGEDPNALPLLVTSTDGSQRMTRIGGGPSSPTMNPSPPLSANGRAVVGGGTPRITMGGKGGGGVVVVAQDDHPFLAFLESESQPTAFDVPFEDRLMADLYATMCSVCDFTGQEGGVPLEPAHPLYLVYRNGAHSLPAPPVQNLLLSPPHPLEGREGTTPSILRAIPSELKGVEETPVLDGARRVMVGRALKTMGLGDLTGEELHLLDGIIQDTTIEVPSDDDISDGYGSDYDSEGGSEDEFGRGY